jgi:hypothetical protein
MKKKFKNWQKYLMFLSCFFLGAFLLVGLVYAATTATINQVPAGKITANANDFLVLDFNINVDNETTIAGTAPDAGSPIVSSKPGDWATVKFNDASSGGAWNSGTDWIGNSEVDAYVLGGTIVGCPTDESPPYNFADDRNSCENGARHDTPNGTTGDGGEGGLHWLTDSATICTDSYTDPTCVIQASSNDCSVSTTTIKGDPGCSALNLVTNSLAKDYGWVYHDVSDQNYTHGLESIFIIASPYREEGAGRNTIFYYESSETIAGSNPEALTWNGSAWIPTPISSTKPADWTTVAFYDKHPGADWAPSNDWIGLDANEDGIYLDRLQTLTVNLHEDSTVSPANVSNVKFYAASGTHLGTVTSYDGGGSGWYLDNIDRALSADSNRIYVTMSLSGASHGQTVRATVPLKDLNSNGSFNLGDAGVFLSSRVLGSFGNAAFMTVDTIPPTLTITIDGDEFKKGDSATVTFEFSEEVVGFDAGDITVNNGSLSSFTSSDSITWTATYTPTDNLDYVASNRISVAMAGLTDVAGNFGVGTTYSNYYEIDTKKPTLVSAVFNDSKVQIGDTPTVTFTFSESVSGFTLENAITSVANGALSNLQTANNITYTATFTPTEGVDYVGTNKIVVNMSVIEDTRLSTKSNLGTGTADSSNYELDTLRPTLISATFANNEMLVGENSLVTFVFSEKVKDFDLTDLVTPFGSLTAPSSSDDGITWTATFTPTVDIEELDDDNVITISMDGIKDKRLDPAGAKGNLGEGDEESEAYKIDTLRPTLSIGIEMDNDGLLIGDTAIITFTFSEEVKDFSLNPSVVTRVDNASWDLTYGTGGLSTTDGKIYTAKLVPDDSVDYVTDNIIRVDMTQVSDVNLKDGNTGLGNTDSDEYAIDTTRPTLDNIDIDDAELIIGETAIITFTFSEEVSGLDLDSITPENGSWCGDYGLQTLDNMEYTAKLIPDSDIDYDDTNKFTVDMTDIFDVNIAPGNHGAGADGDNTHSPNYELDTTRPSLEITMSRYIINRDQTATVTFTFSEEVDGFDLSDVGAENGELGDLTTLDDIVYTATFTPDMDVEDDTNVLSFDMSNVADVNILPGNDGEGDVYSLNYIVDTINPSFEIQYYHDRALTAEIDGESYLKAGTYYIKITSNEELSSSPTISIDAEGTANDVVNGSTAHISDSKVYRYTRVITNDISAIGTNLETITISASDAVGNAVVDISPTNEGAKAIYTDTVAPVVDAGSNRGNVSSIFTQTGSATDIDGSGIASYLWTKQSGFYDVTFGSANSAETTVSVRGGGPYVIRLTVTDNAGNSSSDTFTFTWGSVPSSGGGSAPSIGSGSLDQSTPLGGDKSIGSVDSSGVNVLSYIDSNTRFDAINSSLGTFINHTLKIKDVNTLNKSIKIEISPNNETISLNEGDVVSIDLDGDGVDDISLEYNELLVNRVDITISQLEFDDEKEETIDDTSAPIGTEIDIEEIMKTERELVASVNAQLTNRLAGRILLQVENNGQAWYVEPVSKAKHFMGRPHDAFSMMRRFGLGISNDNFDRFQSSGVPARFSGRIFLKVEANGEAYYVDPVDMRMHYLGRPDDAFRIMRELALGINNENIRQIAVGE